MVSEIQDSLREIYRFYQTDTSKYENCELMKLLKRVDFMFNTFVRENVFKVLYVTSAKRCQMVRFYKVVQSACFRHRRLVLCLRIPSLEHHADGQHESREKEAQQ